MGGRRGRRGRQGRQGRRGWRQGRGGLQGGGARRRNTLSGGHPDPKPKPNPNPILNPYPYPNQGYDSSGDELARENEEEEGDEEDEEEGDDEDGDNGDGLPRVEGGKGGKGGVRARRCGQCAGCLITVADSCGECSACRNMVRFGGPGTCKQCCVHRQCSALTLTPMRPKTSGEAETEVGRAPTLTAPKELEAAMQEDEATREVWAAAKAVAKAGVETERTLHGWRIWYEGPTYLLNSRYVAVVVGA